uniref:hypothetical protein n=1 Tax=Mycoplasmopsis bovis TaxID=28903 RepID=UPI003D272798
ASSYFWTVMYAALINIYFLTKTKYATAKIIVNKTGSDAEIVEAEAREISENDDSQKKNELN